MHARFKPTRPTTPSLVSCATVILLLALLVSSCGGPKPTPTPIPIPTATPDDWTRIQQAGKLVVGTASGYPPFEYYNDAYQLDGFDIALMRDLGRRLNLPVEFRDYPFEGLAVPLLNRQVDAVIAAISLTPERQAAADFTLPYYAGQDVEVALPGTQMALATLDDMAAYRVGVERGTVYQNILEDKLVATGKMAAHNLLAYARSEDSLRDLQENRLDLVMMDAASVEPLIKNGTVRMAGQALYPQQFAIGLPKGSAALLEKLNAALAQAFSDGTMQKLSQQYLNGTLPPIPPQPTAIPGPTATPPACTDDMLLVQDLSYPDNNMTSPPAIAPGQPFVKGWRVRNSGTCTWNAGYRLVFERGNTDAARMSGEPVAVPRDVPPGDTLDLQVNLIAPLTPGIYQAFWKLVSAAGQGFGQRLTVGIQVGAPPTLTPAPTAPPPPGIYFNAQPMRVRAGDPVQFSWRVDNARAVYFYAAGDNWQYYPVPPNSSQVVYPPYTQYYELRVIRPDNRTEVQRLMITVDPAANAPQIVQFSVDPAFQINLGDCVDLYWEVRGQVNTVRVLRNQAEIYNRLAPRGSTRDCPTTVGQVVYLLEASGPGGTSRYQRQITVNPPGPQPTPTAIIDPAVIMSFDVSPNNIKVQECVNISWDVIGGVSSVHLVRSDGRTSQLEAHGTLRDCLDTVGTTTYRLEAYNPLGLSDSRSQDVLVEPVLPTVGPMAPVINRFYPSAQSIPLGQCLTLYWNVAGSELVMTLERDGTPLPNPGSPDGSQGDCPPSAGSVTYRLVAGNSGGETSATVVIDVTDMPGPLLPTVEPLPGPIDVPTDEPAPDTLLAPTP